MKLIKIVKSEPMSITDYELKHGVVICFSDETEGYSIEYANGQKEWMPLSEYVEKMKAKAKEAAKRKEIEEENMLSTFGFGTAFEALRKGECVYRHCWGSDKFVYRQCNCDVESEYVPKMTSLPKSVKAVIASKQLDSIHYRNQCSIMDLSTGKITNWSPSTDDLFAGDWDIFCSKC